MDNFENNWKNKTVFQEQLELNLKELDGRFMPSHWQALIDFLFIIQEELTFNETPPTEIRTFLDIGCGCGAVSKLIKSYTPTFNTPGLTMPLKQSR